MKTPKTTSDELKAIARERFFTLESANQALVYVRRIVSDIVDRYQGLMALRARREELALEPARSDELDPIREEIERQVEHLNRLHEELREVGCELKDWSTGLVDFPARRDGRKIWLCWKLGEGQVDHWHEVHAGYAGRTPIDAEFELDADE